MATPIIAEKIKSTRSKDKITIHGFIYTLNKSTNQFKHWVCQKRGTCKARITTNCVMVITKPKNFTEILESHTHGPDMVRIDMLRGYNNMEERAAEYRTKN